MTRKRTSTEWAELVREWQRSGLTARGFAKRAKLNPQTLMWWRWRLATKDPSRTPRRAPQAKAGAALVPVQVIQVREPAAAETPVDVVLGDVVVRVRRGFDSATLARVLDVVDGSC